MQADDLSAEITPMVVVLPLTTRVYPQFKRWRVAIPARGRLEKSCQVVTDQTRTLDRIASAMARWPCSPPKSWRRWSGSCAVCWACIESPRLPVDSNIQGSQPWPYPNPSNPPSFRLRRLPALAGGRALGADRRYRLQHGPTPNTRHQTVIGNLFAALHSRLANPASPSPCPATCARSSICTSAAGSANTWPSTRWGTTCTASGVARTTPSAPRNSSPPMAC